MDFHLSLRRVWVPRWAPGSSWCCSPCRGRHCPGGSSPGPPPHYSGAHCSQHTWEHHHHHHVMILVIISPVTVHMEAPVQGHHPDRLLLARGGHDGVSAHRAPGSKPSVEILKFVRVKYLPFLSIKDLTSMQWIWFAASTVKGMPSRLFVQTTHVKQLGW